MAIERFGVPLYVYHEIVHNTTIVSDFRGRGVVFVDSIDEIPEGARVLFSAHGVSPSVKKEAKAKKLQTIDATCPLVKKIHEDAIKYANFGYKIVLIGHPNHDEIIGTLGEAPDVSYLLASVEDIDSLPFSGNEKLAYLTQTTLSIDDSDSIIARLKEKFPNIESSRNDNICFATRNRQEAVRKFASGADRAIVIGSSNSSNSRRLAELARSIGIKTDLLEGPGDLDCDSFDANDTVLVTAGASAPENLVQKCIEKLRFSFDCTLEERVLTDESVSFPVPLE